MLDFLPLLYDNNIIITLEMYFSWYFCNGNVIARNRIVPFRVDIKSDLYYFFLDVFLSKFG